VERANLSRSISTSSQPLLPPFLFKAKKPCRKGYTHIDSHYIRVVVGLDTLGHQAAAAGRAEGVLNTLLGEGVFLHNAAGQQNKRTRQFAARFSPLLHVSVSHPIPAPRSSRSPCSSFSDLFPAIPQPRSGIVERDRGKRRKGNGANGKETARKKTKTQTHRHGPLPLLELHVLARDVDEQVAVAHADGAVAAADAGRRVVEWRGDGGAVGDGAAVAGRVVGCRGRGFCCCCCCCCGGGGGRGCVVAGGAGGHGGVGGGEERGRK